MGHLIVMTTIQQNVEKYSLRGSSCKIKTVT